MHTCLPKKRLPSPYRHLRRARRAPLPLRNPRRKVGKPATSPTTHARVHGRHVMPGATAAAPPSTHACHRWCADSSASDPAAPPRRRRWSRASHLVRFSGRFLDLLDGGCSLLVLAFPLRNKGFQVFVRRRWMAAVKIVRKAKQVEACLRRS